MVKADEKICPKCAETIKKAATVCKHCGYTYSAEDIAKQNAADAEAAKIGGIGCLVIIIIAVFAMTMCSSSSNEVTKADDTAKAAAKAAEEASNKRQGFHCLSAWMGHIEQLWPQ